MASKIKFLTCFTSRAVCRLWQTRAKRIAMNWVMHLLPQTIHFKKYNDVDMSIHWLAMLMCALTEIDFCIFSYVTCSFSSDPLERYFAILIDVHLNQRSDLYGKIEYTCKTWISLILIFLQKCPSTWYTKWWWCSFHFLLATSHVK